MQSSFSELEYGAKKATRRDRFLAEIEAIPPWTDLVMVLVPFYSKGEGRGRAPISLVRMLSISIFQQCFGLPDDGTEDAFYNSQAIRRFIGIDLTFDTAPDATTLLKFRRLLEAHSLTKVVFDTVNGHLAAKGLLLKEGTNVDATIIAPPLTRRIRRENVIRTCIRQKRQRVILWHESAYWRGQNRTFCLIQPGTVHSTALPCHSH